MRRFGKIARRPLALSATPLRQALCCSCFAGLLLIAVIAPMPVSAQSAQELYDKGITALSAGRYAEAVQAFDASYRATPAASATPTKRLRRCRAA
jgi:outer membrane protein assembly factor BamD (BamD/ComL family)